jgi:hypothetical protein
MTIMTIARRAHCKGIDDLIMLPENRFHTRCRSMPRRLLLSLVLAVMSGCYDGEALMKEAHSTVLTASLAEVELGEFVTTLPRDAESGVFTTLNLRIFGTVTRANQSAVEKQLRADNFKLRHEMLAALRHSTRDELGDPTFAKLRARILQVANQVLADAPVKEVGFYQLTVR